MQKFYILSVLWKLAIWRPLWPWKHCRHHNFYNRILSPLFGVSNCDLVWFVWSPTCSLLVKNPLFLGIWVPPRSLMRSTAWAKAKGRLALSHPIQCASGRKQQGGATLHSTAFFPLEFLERTGSSFLLFPNLKTCCPIKIIIKDWRKHESVT